MQEDAEAFAPLAAAYGLPKDTPEQAADKERVMETALTRAALVPIKIMQKCLEGITLAYSYAVDGSTMAISDAGCAAVLCKAALQAASLNVFVNTKLMTNREFATALEHTAEQLLDAGTSYADEAFHYVNEKLRSK